MNASVYFNGSYTNTYFYSNNGTSKRSTDKVDSYWYLDLTGSYQLPSHNAYFLFGIKDITNADYPFINGTDGRPFDAGRVNTQGRTMYLQVSKRFEF